MLDIVFYVLAGIVIISAIIRIVKNKKISNMRAAV